MTADSDGLPFAIVRRGFDRAQVEDRLTKLLAERDGAHSARQNALAERERLSRELDVSRGETRAARAEVAETRAEVERLAGQVAELSTIPSTVDGMSDRLQQMVRVAQDEVNDMRSRGTRGAAQILSMAQAEADELRESSRAERRTFEAEQRSAQEELNARLEESRTQLAALREESDGQRARLDAEIAERRAHEEQALAAELADRREIMLADLATQERRQREEAQRITDAAAARARALVAEAAAETDRARSQTRDQVNRASDELEQLRALQHQVAEQLAGVRSLLDWTLPRINPVGAPPAGDATTAFPATEAVPAVPPAAMESAAPPREVANGAHGFDADGSDVAAFGQPVVEEPVFREQAYGDQQGYGDQQAYGEQPYGEQVYPEQAVDERGAATYDATAAEAPRYGTPAPADGEARADLDEVREPVAEQVDPPTIRDTRVPQPRGGETDGGRPSPVARVGHRAGARR